MSKRALLAIAGLFLVAVTAVVIVVAVAVHVRKSQLAVLSEVSSQPTPPQVAQSQPKPVSTSVATKPTETYEKSYLDVIRAAYPSLPGTRPLAVPLDLGQAARFIVKDPVYLSKSRGDLWITRPDAPPIREVLKDAIDPNAPDPQSHVLRERVLSVHWMPGESGVWFPYIIYKATNGADVTWAKGHLPLPSRRDFDWDRAFSWNELLIVPSRRGISVFSFASHITESYQSLIPSDASKPSQPQVLLDWQGLLAWAPWENDATGSRGAFRYVEGKWTALGPDQGWREKLAYLVPLRDGSVFQFIESADDSITMQTTALDQAQVDDNILRQLVRQLNDIDQDVRRKALADLSNFGPGAWPLLQKLMPNQPPQAKVLIAQLLRDKNRPTLSGMTLLGKRELKLINRLSDGGVVFYADQGVSIPESDDQTSVTAPAWLSIRPGHYVELLPAAILVDLKPGSCNFDVVGDQWIVTSDARGPRLFYGNGTATILRKDELAFTQVVGMDQLGRWLFRKPQSSNEQAPETLVIDPHLPDPTPRLPVWQLAIAQTVGWDKDNWPVVQNGAAFALMESDWRGLDKDEKIYTRPDEIPPTTAPTTQATTNRADQPLLVAPDGTRYFDGLNSLRVAYPSGKQLTWPLPDSAIGAGPAWLVRDHSGKLFLFNQPGRLLRIAPTQSGAEPFKLEATFTHNIPNTSKTSRMWLDPAGRIDIEWGNHLAILFPDGYIPRAIMEKIVDRSGLDAEGL